MGDYELFPVSTCPRCGKDHRRSLPDRWAIAVKGHCYECDCENETPRPVPLTVGCYRTSHADRTQKQETENPD